MSTPIVAHPRAKAQSEKVFVSRHVISSYKIMDIFSWRCERGAEQPAFECGFDSPAEAFDAGMLDHYFPARQCDAVQAERAKFVRPLRESIEWIKGFADSNARLSRDFIKKHDLDNLRYHRLTAREFRRNAHFQRRTIRLAVKAVAQ